MPIARRPRACKPVFGKSLKDFKGPPQLFRDLMMELKQWMSVNDLFAAENQKEKVFLMRQAWDMGKDPLVIMRSSPHALAGSLKLWLECLPEPLIAPDLAKILVQAIYCLDEAERLPVMQQVLCHVEGKELQVLYPLLEFLHHHRLNAADPHALSDAFALLLMRPQCDSGFRDAEHIAEAYGVLTDLLIRRYRTLLSGVVSVPRTDFNPVVTDQPVQQLSSQQGAFGGRAAVAKLFGRTDTGELLPIAEVPMRSNSSSSEGDFADVFSAAVDSVMHEGPESAIAAAAGLTIMIPAATAQKADCQMWQPEVTEDVSHDVESLLTASLDNMLFGKDEGVLSEAFMLPAQHSAEVSTDAISERRESMDSVRTEDSCESMSGACYEHLQRHSPTSLLPEHPFSPPVLEDETTCKNHPYLHASMWMAPLPHQDSHIIKGKSGAPLSGCHKDAHGHVGARVHQSLVSYFGSWTQAPVPMRT